MQKAVLFLPDSTYIKIANSNLHMDPDRRGYHNFTIPQIAAVLSKKAVIKIEHLSAWVDFDVQTTVMVLKSLECLNAPVRLLDIPSVFPIGIKVEHKD
jgi:hypothetical protein